MAKQQFDNRAQQAGHGGKVTWAPGNRQDPDAVAKEAGATHAGQRSKGAGRVARAKQMGPQGK